MSGPARARLVERLGDPGGLRRLDDPTAIAAAVVAVATAARRELLLLTTGCEPALFDQAPLLAAIRSLVVIRAAQPPVRVLCAEPLPGRGHGHRLFALARRVPSAIGLRVLPDDLPRPSGALLIGDARGCCVLPDATPGVAFVGADAAPEAGVDPGAGAGAGAGVEVGALARRERRRFLALWAASLPSVELRTLGL